MCARLQTRLSCWDDRSEQMAEPAVVARWQLPDLPRPVVRVPSVDRATMLTADRIATDTIGLALSQMLENAGRELANLARLALGGAIFGRRIVVLAGTGNNAAGGMVAARRLAGWGAEVLVVFARPVLRLRPGPRAQLEPLIAAGATPVVAGHDRAYPDLAVEMRRADAVIDALIGYSLCGAPNDDYQPLIGMARLGEGPVISLDLPSGIDASSGERPGMAVAADITLALALPKRGSETGDGKRLSGARYLADVGIPASVFAQLGIEAGGIFSEGPLIRLD